jgi:hypothetical protein
MADRVANGEDPFPPLLRNPLAPRQPLREIVAPLDDSVFEGPVGKKIVDTVAALVTRADQGSKDMETFASSVFSAFERSDAVARGLHETLQEIKVALNMPKMRPESPSSVDLRVDARKSLSQALREEAAKTPGPNVNLPPERIEALADEQWSGRMAAYEEKKELERRREQEKQDALTRAKNDADRRQLVVLTVSGVLVALVGIFGTYYATRAANERDKAVAHEQGLAEGMRNVPTLAPPAASVAAPPADSPASAAPAKRTH